MILPSTRLKEIGLTLPDLPTPAGSYVPVKRSGSLIATSGMLPIDNGEIVMTGRLGCEIDLEEGIACARLAVLNALAVAAASVEGIDNITGIFRLEGFVASVPTFKNQAGVLNGASDLLIDIFGDAGRHTRFAVGAAVLPLNAPVELALWAESSQG